MNFHTLKESLKFQVAPTCPCGSCTPVATIANLEELVKFTFLYLEFTLESELVETCQYLWQEFEQFYTSSQFPIGWNGPEHMAEFFTHFKAMSAFMNFHGSEVNFNGVSIKLS